MKGVRYPPDGPEFLRYEEVPDPDVADHEVLIQAEAISVEGGDLLHNRGSGLRVIGYQCAGTVLEVGAQVSRVQVGDRVVSIGMDGAYAQLRAAAETRCWQIPAHLGTEEAACVPISFATADDSLVEFGRLRAGGVVLIHAGAGGVGIAAIQLAKRAGAHVLATASRDDKLDRLAALGVDHGINYRTADFAAEVERLTDGRGADVVLDTVGGQVLQDSLRCLAYRGRCIMIGTSRQQPAPPIDVTGMQFKNQSLTGYFLGAELAASDRLRARIATLLSEVADGALRVFIDRRYALAEVTAAHAYAESRQPFGRVLLLP